MDTYIAVFFHERAPDKMRIIGVFSSIENAKHNCEMSHRRELPWIDNDPISRAADDMFQFRVYRTRLDSIPPLGFHRVL